jgi:dihydroorotate dehydrogenase electron transfer subunit
MNTTTEQATLLTRYPCPGDQQVIRLAAPLIANQAKPGQQLIIDRQHTTYIMRADAKAGWLELLLSSDQCHPQQLTLTGPIGQPFITEIENKDYLLIGEQAGIAPIIFMAEQLKNSGIKPLVLLESEHLPFTPRPSKIMIPGMPPGVIATMPLLDDWGIPCRIASQQDGPGCYHGPLIELVEVWLKSGSEQQKKQIKMIVCGSEQLKNC